MSSVVSLLALAVPATTPLLLACLGEMVAERAGVLNLGIEGLMAIGALAAIIVVILTGNLWAGAAVAMVVAAGLSILFGFLTLTLKSDQIVSGVMIALFGIALANFYGDAWSGQTVDGFSQTTLPLIGEYLRAIPVLGEVVFYMTPIDYAAVSLVPVMWYLFFRTGIGLKITAVGNNAKAADTEGIDPIKVRYLCVLFSGALAGLGGAALSLGFTGFWSSNLVDNRGWVAIALVIVARWDPLKALVGAYGFGVIYSLQFGLQGVSEESLPLSEYFANAYSVLLDPVIISTYPFVVTILVLIAFSIGTRTELIQPKEIGKMYFKEGE